MRIALLISAALIAAGGTGFYLFEEIWAPRQPGDAPLARVEAPTTREVFVPAVEMAAGSIIVPGKLARTAINESAITAEMIVADEAGKALLTGSVARQVLPQGVPIARSATVQPGDRSFLAAVLPQGKRAISITIDEVTGLSGLVLPGDRVDIILTYSLTADVIEAERDIRASETLLTNLRVLALDQRLQHTDPIAPDGSKSELPPIARIATLEVTPQQAEVITLATTLGSLSLVLNSVRDGGDPAEIAKDGDAEPETLPLRLSNRGGQMPSLASTGPMARPMTLDSDVTSLLQRQAQGGAGEPGAVTNGSPIPLADRMSRVQIVRGTDTRAVDTGAIADPAAAPEPAAE